MYYKTMFMMLLASASLFSSEKNVMQTEASSNTALHQKDIKKMFKPQPSIKNYLTSGYMMFNSCCCLYIAGCAAYTAASYDSYKGFKSADYAKGSLFYTAISLLSFDIGRELWRLNAEQGKDDECEQAAE